MTWTVSRLGTGTFKYDRVIVTLGGALQCQTWIREGHPDDDDDIYQTVAFFGPGMWVTAFESDS